MIDPRNEGDCLFYLNISMKKNIQAFISGLFHQYTNSSLCANVCEQLHFLVIDAKTLQCFG